MKKFGSERELSLQNPFAGVSAETVAETRWKQYGKTVLDQAMEILAMKLTAKTDAYTRTGLVHNWNDYTDAMQRGTVYLPSNPSWKK